MGKLEHMEPKEVSDYLMELRSQLPLVSSTKKSQDSESNVSIHQKRQGKKKEKKTELPIDCDNKVIKETLEQQGILEDDTSIYEYDCECLKHKGKSC